MGDLNMGPADATRSGMRSLATAATFPVGTPTRQLDHILTDHPRLITMRPHAPMLPISDHRALVVDVDQP
jgi:endonuclease/exonuclease/phosphatase family metal-dependent hydrolase